MLHQRPHENKRLHGKWRAFEVYTAFGFEKNCRFSLFLDMYLVVLRL